MPTSFLIHTKWWGCSPLSETYTSFSCFDALSTTWQPWPRVVLKGCWPQIFFFFYSCPAMIILSLCKMSLVDHAGSTVTKCSFPPAIKPSPSAVLDCDLQTLQAKCFTGDLGVNAAMWRISSLYNGPSQRSTWIAWQQDIEWYNHTGDVWP